MIPTAGRRTPGPGTTGPHASRTPSPPTSASSTRAARTGRRPRRRTVRSFERIRKVLPYGLNSPRQRVIGTMAPCCSRNPIPPAGAPYRDAPRLLHRSALQQKRAARNCAARRAGSDPPKTCGFAAQWVFPSHTHRAGVAPGAGVPPGRGREPVSVLRPARTAAAGHAAPRHRSTPRRAGWVSVEIRRPSSATSSGRAPGRAGRTRLAVLPAQMVLQQHAHLGHARARQHRPR